MGGEVCRERPFEAAATVPRPRSEARGWTEECAVFCLYLTGRPPDPPLTGRYLQAQALLFSDDQDAAQTGPVTFARRHPWSLPYLDALLAVLDPQSLLRKKLHVMVAILETTPDFTGLFFPERQPGLLAGLKLLGYGCASMGKLLVGLLVYPLAVRAR
jgi:hypothetical protein